MAGEKEKKQKGVISRRDFIKGTGLAVGGVAISSTVLSVACAPAAPAVTEPVKEPVKPGANTTTTAPPQTVTKTVEVEAQLSKFIVNGDTYEFKIKDNWTLNEVIRNKMGLTGTKVSCGEGSCGMCTVIMDGRRQLSCITLALEAVGKNITTIEGLAQPGGKYDPVQAGFLEENGMQCGMCTPGQIISAKVFLAKNPNPTDAQIKREMSGNLCICGSYEMILMSVRTAAKLIRGG